MEARTYAKGYPVKTDEDASEGDMAADLQSIAELENRIQCMRNDLCSLSKMEQECDKSISQVYQQSLLVARNKINVANNRIEASHRLEKENREKIANLNRVKELRAREITDLRNAKNELRKARESERVSVCNQSALFASKIKQNQCEELQRKMRMATQIKQEYLSYRRSQEEARSESLKRKEQELMAKSLAKLNQLPQLAWQLQKLAADKQLIQQRIEQKRVLDERIREETAKLQRMKDAQVIQAAQIASQELLTERNQNNKPSEAVLVEVKTIFKEQLQKNPALLDSFLLP